MVGGRLEVSTGDPLHVLKELQPTVFLIFTTSPLSLRVVHGQTSSEMQTTDDEGSV